jgi:hypothetical protein
MRRRPLTLTRTLGFAIAAPCLAGLAALASTSISACGVGDQYCPDDTIDTDLNDDCPYGPPGGPQEPRESCPTVVFLDPGDPACADASFDAVFETLTGPPGNCTLGACHGTPEAAATAFGVLLTDDVNQFYTELSEYTNAGGEPYLGQGVGRSWILCNLKAQIGGGSTMPKGTGLVQEADQLALVENWVVCGMNPPGGGATTASSSSSSSSSATGSGGAGGGEGGAGSGTGGAGGG